MLDTVNPYVKIFRNAWDMLQTNNVVDFKIHLIKAYPGWQYSMPTVDGVATFIVRGDYGWEEKRDILVLKIDDNLQ